MTKLNKGDVIFLDKGMTVRAKVPITNAVKAEEERDVEIGKIYGQFDSSVLIGKYIVQHTVGQSNGPQEPLAWHVFCVKEDEPIEVNFWQNGAFVAKIDDISTI